MFWFWWDTHHRFLQSAVKVENFCQVIFWKLFEVKTKLFLSSRRPPISILAVGRVWITLYPDWIVNISPKIFHHSCNTYENYQYTTKSLELICTKLIFCGGNFLLSNHMIWFVLFITNSYIQQFVILLAITSCTSLKDAHAV